MVAQEDSLEEESRSSVVVALWAEARMNRDRDQVSRLSQLLKFEFQYSRNLGSGLQGGKISK